MVQTIDREDLSERLENESVTLVDVLSEEQYADEHIPGSINIPLDQLEDRAEDELDRDEDIVVYCASTSCQASPKAWKLLDRMGYETVWDYEEGLKGWREAGNETVSGA